VSEKSKTKQEPAERDLKHLVSRAYDDSLSHAERMDAFEELRARTGYEPGTTTGSAGSDEVRELVSELAKDRLNEPAADAEFQRFTELYRRLNDPSAV